jgi:hypothetical protein
MAKIQKRTHEISMSLTRSPMKPILSPVRL